MTKTFPDFLPFASLEVLAWAAALGGAAGAAILLLFHAGAHGYDALNRRRPRYSAGVAAAELVIVLVLIAAVIAFAGFGQ